MVSSMIALTMSPSFVLRALIAFALLTPACDITRSTSLGSTPDPVATRRRRSRRLAGALDGLQREARLHAVGQQLLVRVFKSGLLLCTDAHGGEGLDKLATRHQPVFAARDRALNPCDRYRHVR